MKYYIEFWKRMFDFRGVASRPQYWYAVLINAVILFILGLFFQLFSGKDGADLITGLYSVIILLPSIAISVRRLHDQNRSGWFYLINLIPAIGSIIIFVLMLFGTVRINNRWRMYDIQRGYIKEDLYDEPLSNNQWTYRN